MSNFIIVVNSTGGPQNYHLINETPKINDKVSSPPDTWNTIYITVTIPPGGVASFEVAKEYYAFAGIIQPDYIQGKDKTIAVQTTKVTLGRLKDDDDDTLEYGASVRAMIHGDYIAPILTTEGVPKQGHNHCFEIVTGDDFPKDQAKNAQWIIGLANRASYDSKGYPVAVFVPQPSMSYQIRPSRTFYLTCGERRERGELIDVTKVGPKLALNLNKLPQKTKVEHTATGELKILTTGQESSLD